MNIKHLLRTVFKTFQLHFTLHTCRLTLQKLSSWIEHTAQAILCISCQKSLFSLRSEISDSWKKSWIFMQQEDISLCAQQDIKKTQTNYRSPEEVIKSENAESILLQRKFFTRCFGERNFWKVLNAQRSTCTVWDGLCVWCCSVN